MQTLLRTASHSSNASTPNREPPTLHFGMLLAAPWRGEDWEDWEREREREMEGREAPAAQTFVAGEGGADRSRPRLNSFVSQKVFFKVVLRKLIPP